MSPERRVLVVDDDRDAREMLCEVLGLEGYTAVGAANGREALAYLRGAGPPQVILLDLMMPVMDGWELWRALGEDPALSSVPLVVISGGSAVDERAAGLSAAHTLKKPVDLDDLLDALARLCP